MAIAGEFGLDLTPEGRAALSMLDELEDIVVEVGYQADQMAIDGETSLAEIAYSQTKAVADAAKDSAETSKAAAETSKDLLNKTTAAAQQAAASAASASYALGPDESGRLSFFIKKST